MKKLVFIIALAFIFSCNQNNFPAKTAIANTEIQNDRQQTILAGHCSVSVFDSAPYKTWFDKSYNEYAVDTSSAAKLKPLLKDKTLEVFLGSWCGDSKREVPRLIKILNYVHFDTAQLQLIFVNNSTAAYKQSPQHEEKNKFIHHVPTIIVYSKKQEQARIIESPVVSLEKDLLSILTSQDYVPQYKAAAYWHTTVKGKEHLMSDSKLAQLALILKPLSNAMHEFNALGYVVLAQKKYAEAINIFKLNTLLHPDNAGTFDSLAEAYMVKGDNNNARYYYKKVLEMKPGDENAIKMLQKLK